ncbi:MAG: hypothetical protein P8Y66_09440 [Nitrospirota bacterium]
MEKKNTHQEECPSCATLGAAIAREAPREDRVLPHWPVQIRLIGTVAPFLQNADLMVAADCTAFAVRDFQGLRGDRKLLIGCPKLDNPQQYVEKFTEILRNIPIKSLTVLRMEVPCCGGMTGILTEAVRRSGVEIPLREVVIGVKGDVLGERELR